MKLLPPFRFYVPNDFNDFQFPFAARIAPSRSALERQTLRTGNWF
ncbi:MAG: hypothetical protein ABI954_15345 [Pyrinomonadaceae bacterium]